MGPSSEKYKLCEPSSILFFCADAACPHHISITPIEVKITSANMQRQAISSLQACGVPTSSQHASSLLEFHARFRSSASSPWSLMQDQHTGAVGASGLFEKPGMTTLEGPNAC
eukprot:6455301-Amphidinium_carterae.1